MRNENMGETAKPGLTSTPSEPGYPSQSIIYNLSIKSTTCEVARCRVVGNAEPHPNMFMLNSAAKVNRIIPGVDNTKRWRTKITKETGRLFPDGRYSIPAIRGTAVLLFHNAHQHPIYSAIIREHYNGKFAITSTRTRDSTSPTAASFGTLGKWARANLYD